MSIAVFDVGGTFIKYCVMNDGNMEYKGKIPTPHDNQNNFLVAIKSVLDQMADIEGIAFSLPGVIDVDFKYVYAGGSLHYNNHTDIKEWENYFQLPIQIENDARCAALAELTSGNMKDIENGLVLTFGTGVGGGIILNGELYKGSHLIGGEVSVIYSKDRKTLGTKALFGSIGSVYNLVEKIAKAKNSDSRDGREIFNWISQEDEIASTIFEQYCYDIVTEFHNIQCLLDPQRICIGGGASENPIFIEGIKRAQNKFYEDFSFNFPKTEIKKCKYNNDANLLGAYYHYKEHSKI